MRDNLTQSDIDKMEAEIEYRKVTLRPKLLEDLKIARAHGDLSENFEYYAAKREKNMNESRIRYLDRMVRTANIIDDTSAEDEVGINNTVTIEVVDDGSASGDEGSDSGSSSSGGQITVKENVNVREGASETAKKLGVAYRGDKFDLIEKTNGWCKIRYNGKEAYVKADFVE